MKSWLNHDLTANYFMDDAGQIMEVAPRLTEDVDEERPPPDPDIHHDDNREPRQDHRDTEGGAQDQAEGHVTSGTGERRMRQEEEASNRREDRYMRPSYHVR